MTSLAHAPLETATPSSFAMHYRPDIDGLRAIAVIAVILYHFKVNGFSGGFVGVDIFFVISGYLITQGIISKKNTASFDLADFYTRRVRRLMPALLATVLTSYIAAAFLFSPTDFKQMSASTVHAVAALSNIYFWLESGYFDSASTLKPLLHTWSLSVEIQFYIVWPAILLTILRFKHQAASIALIAVAGAAAAIIYLQSDASGAFFLTPFRMHEFILGSLVVFIAKVKINKSAKETLYAIGLIMVFYPIFLFDSESTLFPGVAALVPATGAALMILSGNEARGALPFKTWMARKVGEISYSLYLVHWPVFVFFSYVLIGEVTLGIQTLLLASTLGLALALYLFIEKPFRSTSTARLKGPQFSLACLACSMAITVIAASSWGQNGWDWRLPQAIREINNIDTAAEQRAVWLNHNALNAKTGFAENGKKKLLIIGDSQAGDLINILKVSGKLDNYDAVSRVIASECATISIASSDTARYYSTINPFSMKNPATVDKCSKLLARANDQSLFEQADEIFIAMRWRDFAEPFYLQSIQQLKTKTPAKITVFGRKDLTKSSIAIATNFGRVIGIDAFASRFRNPDAEKLNSKLKRLPDVRYLDMMSLTCPSQDKCRVLDEQGKPLFFDNEHLTTAGTLQFAKSLSTLL